VFRQSHGTECHLARAISFGYASLFATQPVEVRLQLIEPRQDLLGANWFLVLSAKEDRGHQTA